MNYETFFTVLAWMIFIWSSLGIGVAVYEAASGKPVGVKAWGVIIWIVSLAYLITGWVS